MKSLFQSSHERNQRVDLRVGQLLSKGRHFLFPVMDRIEETLVGYLCLPLRVGQLSRVIELRLECFCLAIFAMTSSTLFGKQSARFISFRISARDYCMGRIDDAKGAKNSAQY